MTVFSHTAFLHLGAEKSPEKTVQKLTVTVVGHDSFKFWYFFSEIDAIRALSRWHFLWLCLDDRFLQHWMIEKCWGVSLSNLYLVETKERKRKQKIKWFYIFTIKIYNIYIGWRSDNWVTLHYPSCRIYHSHAITYQFILLTNIKIFGNWTYSTIRHSLFIYSRDSMKILTTSEKREEMKLVNLFLLWGYSFFRLSRQY